jgi:hypothetical protein
LESSELPEQIDEVEARDSTQGVASASDSSDSVIDEHSEPARGRTLRIALVVLNLAVYLFGLVLVTGVVGFGIPIDAGPITKITMGALQMWHLSPLLVAVPLAAWGPWPAWQRGVLYFGVVVAASLVRPAFAHGFGVTGTSGGLDALEFATSWLVTTVPAVLLLALLGSFLRLRIGPPRLPPLRLTIVSMMVATTALGVLVTLATASQQVVRYQRTGEYGASASERLEILAQAAIAGSVTAVVLGCVVAASYFWWARLLTLVIIGVYFGFMFYAVFRSAPQFPGVPYSFVWVYVGFLVGVALTAIWMVLNIRLLERSGWPCSRRHLIARPSSELT